MDSFGKVKWFGGYNSKTDRENNFGFISDVSNKDVFLHKTEWGGDSTPKEDELAFYALVTEKNGKWKATAAKPASSSKVPLSKLSDFIRTLEEEKKAPAESISSLKKAYCLKLAKMKSPEVVNQIKLANIGEVVSILSSGPYESKNYETLISEGLAQPITDIPPEYLPAPYFYTHEAEFAEYLRQLTTKQAQALSMDLVDKFPVTLVIYLTLTGLLTSQGFNTRKSDINTYVEDMFLERTLTQPEYLQAYIDAEIKPKGGLRSNEVMAPFVDIALFKKYLYEKNLKFAALYRSSTILQNRADTFILNALFSLYLSENNLDVIYQVFLQQLWKEIFDKHLSPSEQISEILKLFPSCRTLKSGLSCEAVYWQKSDMFLCRGKPCLDPQVIGDPTKSYFEFNVYDWCAHYGIDYLDRQHPSKRDFPIKLSGYLNRVREIFDVIHCRCCGSLMIPDMAYSRVEYTTIENGNYVTRDMAASYRLTVFKCPEHNCEEYDKGYYISHCLGYGCTEIIDDRDLKVRCDSGLRVCKGCGSCCGVHAKSNPVGLCPECGEPLKLYEQRNGDGYSGRNERFVTCSSSCCTFEIPSKNLPKKFYSDSCGPPERVTARSPAQSHVGFNIRRGFRKRAT